MITAEEFFRSKIKEEIEWEGNITLWKVPLNAEQAMRWSHEYSVLKAKYYVEEALKEASRVLIEVDGSDFGVKSFYPLEKIK